MSSSIPWNPPTMYRVAPDLIATIRQMSLQFHSCALLIPAIPFVSLMMCGACLRSSAEMSGIVLSQDLINSNSEGHCQCQHDSWLPRRLQESSIPSVPHGSFAEKFLFCTCRIVTTVFESIVICTTTAYR